ncbi:hypothetical protein [Streptomyces sp. enrichment culture]|uniref:hypothetical protein n=1 Tax=Streptomyces sp. enrichment culture TaxID=1795815 RepID=UPI003F54FBEA
MSGQPDLSLYGRAREAAELYAALTDGGPRTVELTGFAGVGKTALAREVALWTGRETGWPVHRIAARPAPGLPHLAAHAPENRPFLLVLDSPADAAGEAGEAALGVPEGAGEGPGAPGAAVPSVVEAGAAGAQVVEAVGERWPKARILLVGRAPAPVRVDHRLALAPLLPLAACGADAPDPAYELLTAAVGRLGPSVHPRSADGPRIAELARLLDGLPRSLEAAAHWFPLAPPGELLEAARAHPLLLTEPPWRQGGVPGCVRAAVRAVAELPDAPARLLSWAAGRERPWTPAEAPLSRWEAGRAVRDLLARGLVHRCGPDGLRLLTAVTAAVSPLQESITAAKLPAFVPHGISHHN